MRIGYPCINRSIGCRGNRTFRLKSYSEKRFIDTVSDNLKCLSEILRFNVKHGILFFRISSDLVPFASHPVCTFNWRSYFRDNFVDIGKYIKEHDIRISMHPGQYTVLNAAREDAYQNCLRELRYHSDVMDAMGLPDSDKIQIHVGGVYDNKAVSIKRFIARYSDLDIEIKRRLVIENDERQYNISDCKLVHDETGVPILLDVFHHQLNNSDISITEALFLIRRTWHNNHGIPMVDYSQSGSASKKGVHAESIDIDLFWRFINKTSDFDFDIMLEIKDKELSALRALEILKDNLRLNLAQNRVC
jgi:UV DNA damage endonuclease